MDIPPGWGGKGLCICRPRQPPERAGAPARPTRRSRPRRGLVALAIGQVLLIGLLELAKPWPLKIVVDNVLAGKPLGWPAFDGLARPGMLAAACAALVGVYALLGTLGVSSNYTTISVVHRLRDDLRCE